MPILLDTHAALWSVSDQLKPAITKIVERAAAENEVLLSPITAWELGMLVRKNRLAFSVPASAFVRDLYTRPGVITAPVTPAIALSAASFIDFHGDPADRIIVATAIEYRAGLVTRDKAILAFAKMNEALHCIPC